MPGRGGVVKVKVTPLLCTMFAVITVTGPVVPSACAVIEVSVQLLTGAPGMLRNLTDPRVVPKFLPVIVTVVPSEPQIGERLVMTGDVGVVTVNVTPLLLKGAAVVTTTGPVVAPVGTCTVMELAVQLVIVVAAVV